jgi:phenylacetate-CoA ligase
MKAPFLTRLKWTAYLAWHLRGQSRFAFQSLEKIERAQSKRIRRMVSYAYKYVPYYRETMDRLKLRPESFQTASDLARLPIIETSYLQRNLESVTSTEPRDLPDLEMLSSGSSGTPHKMRWNNAAIFENAAHAERERSIVASIVGRFTHYRESVIASPYASETEIQQLYRERALLPSRIMLQHQHLSILDSPETHLRQLNEFKPDIIRAYGSSIAYLFLYIEESGASFHRPKVIFYDAAELPDNIRRLISDKYGIQVLSAYQAIEAFKIGFECERHTGLHLNIDLYPVRIVDAEGVDVAHGESGDVVVSNLVNRAIVLLNYRLGDIAHMLATPCACGRTLPLLSFIDGRVDDRIMLPSGELMPPQSVRLMFTGEQTIRQYQVVQEEVDSFRVAIVGDDRPALRERLEKKFASGFGPNVRIKISFVDSIPPGASGKVRPVLSRVTSNGSAA